ncbi:MAG: acyl-CoA synthetase, partial [Alphaproteobacteria bacterium]
MTTQLKARRPGAAAQPVRAVRLGPRGVVAKRRGDGSILLRSPDALTPYPAKLTERLEHWATAAPARTFLAQRAASGWRKLGYGDTLDQVRRI